jgi:hypothetical protein
MRPNRSHTNRDSVYSPHPALAVVVTKNGKESHLAYRIAASEAPARRISSSTLTLKVGVFAK